jgi:hypothetical protein
MAGEPGVPVAASRPLRNRFKHFADATPVVVDEEEITQARPKPLPSARLGIKKPARGG